VLYLHGGGYAIGSPVSHRHVAAALVEAADATLVVPDYRLAPEHRYPAALHDALAAYTWLLEHGQDPAQLIVAGDSAGGGLALALMISARNQGIRLPAAGVLISPWVDLAGTGDTLETLQARDPIVQKAGLFDMARYYLGDRDPRTPLASPLYADLAGLPPLLIQVGAAETLLDDAIRLAQRAGAADVRVDMQVWPEMVHVWPLFYPELRAGKRALAAAGAFIGQALGT
jgi:acetyl esterase/lipase